MTFPVRLIPWLLLAAALLLAYLTRGILLPFLVGFAVAYLLDPLADRLVERGVGRGLAAGVIIAAFFVAAAGILLALWPLIQAQLAGLVRALPGAIETMRMKAEGLVALLDAEFGAEIGREAQGLLSSAAETGLAAAGAFLQRLFTGGLAILGLLSLVLVSPVVAFYLLRDYDRITRWVEALLPASQAPLIKATLSQIDDVLSGFVRGQLSVVAAMILVYSAGWSIVGLDYALVLGLLAGILTIIPFVGMIFAAALALAVGYGQWGTDWAMLSYVALVWAVAQTLESTVLTPRLLGRHVLLHPVWVLFAIFAGGEIAGFVGVLLAVPAAAVIAVLVRTTLDRYREGEKPAPSPAMEGG